MALKSLDPRVNRLDIPENWNESITSKDSLDQFETYEAFVQVKEGKALEHVGPVHAPNEDMAFLFAKGTVYKKRNVLQCPMCDQN